MTIKENIFRAVISKYFFLLPGILSAYKGLLGKIFKAEHSGHSKKPQTNPQENDITSGLGWSKVPNHQVRENSYLLPQIADLPLCFCTTHAQCLQMYIIYRAFLIKGIRQPSFNMYKKYKHTLTHYVLRLPATNS